MRAPSLFRAFLEALARVFPSRPGTESLRPCRQGTVWVAAPGADAVAVMLASVDIQAMQAGSWLATASFSLDRDARVRMAKVGRTRTFVVTLDGPVGDGVAAALVEAALRSDVVIVCEGRHGDADGLRRLARESGLSAVPYLAS